MDDANPETPWFKPAPDLSQCPPNVFRLCLSHTPDTMPWARRNKIDLMLAGHVHGGQIRFPILGATFVPSRFSRRFSSIGVTRLTTVGMRWKKSHGHLRRRSSSSA